MAGLPPELVIKIIGYLDPRSTFAFARTCTTLWELCTPLMKAHATKLAEEDANPTPFWTMLNNVLDNDDPTCSWYYRDVIGPGVNDKVPTAAGASGIPLHLQEKSLELAQRIGQIYDVHSMNGYLPKDEDTKISPAYVGLLVELLPLMETLHFSTNFGIPLAALQKMILSFGLPGAPKPLPLQYLKVVTIKNSFKTYTRETWCRYFSYLPSGRELCEANMGSILEANPDGNEYSKSYVDILCIDDGRIDAGSFYLIMSKMVALRRFKYFDNVHRKLSDWGVPLQAVNGAQAIVESLVEFAAHSLESLDIGVAGQV
ncbi:hypothetical protein M011DRAFT_462328 [Sporormia fimetaria CBS 119925]|uniref:F-box domain-containing protein n=1 Tax=Sporormia fimetaria CBS 119925 TaxID=1340428 RepID=A0A6A6UZ20_9PLEO|nr:hypothetical protein M011DRAFT_462328 [Sporormia fimetaria CBS 119925]